MRKKEATPVAPHTKVIVVEPRRGNASAGAQRVVDTDGILTTGEPRDGAAIGHAMLLARRRFMVADQPRTVWDMERVRELAHNINELRKVGGGIMGTGILKALSARWEPGAIHADGTIKPGAKVVITSGETRYRASELAGFGPSDPLPVIVADTDARTARRESLFENLFVHPMHPLDESRELHRIRQEEGFSFQQLADYVGRDKNWIQLRLELTALEDDTKQLVLENPDTRVVAVRINRVKDKKLRHDLIEGVRDGSLKKQHVMSIIESYNDSRTHANGTGGGGAVSASSRPAKGTVAAPRINVDEYLQSCIVRADAVQDALKSLRTQGFDPGTAAAKRWKKQIKRVEEALEQAKVQLS